MSYNSEYVHVHDVTILIFCLDKKQKLVRELPVDSLLLETDSPALGPERQVG